ncbi:MAG: hypothetical protein A3F90_00450 [Deltaproteobacteria bacterium RIFCSPLOWO2_12_FULL_60_19]|nr:MAG: hypothetical protein A3F90_00450 [Deltaproteobacteria bacterium RIFCSPLOWO2_12_FULL_60_19]
MTLQAKDSQSSDDPFTVLILDNEVTVSEFVMSPPLSWSRLTEQQGACRIAEGYPSLLTAEQARFEMKNWDQVSLPAIVRHLKELKGGVDYLLIGNNAGQGLPLARSLPESIIDNHAAIIYGVSLPEIKEYEKSGYRTFFRRSEAASRLFEPATGAGRPVSLFFINTIQHNELNYHDP